MISIFSSKWLFGVYLCCWALLQWSNCVYAKEFRNAIHGGGCERSLIRSKNAACAPNNEGDLYFWWAASERRCKWSHAARRRRRVKARRAPAAENKKAGASEKCVCQQPCWSIASNQLLCSVRLLQLQHTRSRHTFAPVTDTAGEEWKLCHDFVTESDLEKPIIEARIWPLIAGGTDLK